MDLSPENLMRFFESHAGRSWSVRELMGEMNIAPSFRHMTQRVLIGMANDGRLVRQGEKRFSIPEVQTIGRGVIHVSKKGAGFLLKGAQDGGDLYIHGDNIGVALDGDTVEVEVIAGRRGREEGRVLRVLEHRHAHIVGQLKRRGAIGAVTPRNVKIGRWIEVPNLPPPKEAPDGAWVRVRVIQWSHAPEEALQAEIVETLGMPGDRGISVLTLLRDMGVELEFPPDVLKEAAHFHKPTSASEESRRLDLRALPIVTIDPATAKDFDDALSIEVLGDGLWKLGVHIADVSQYVRADSPLDIEALRRGTSIYPVDRVVPMLPERLSNDLCSLRPREDRYAMSVFMEINARGEVLRSELAESIICSAHRLNYDEVQEYFDNPLRGAEFAFHDVGPRLLELRELARALNRMRMERGALDLDLPEEEVVCDEAGDTLDLKRHARFESHRLVEECMLIANETVASRMRNERLPLLYRIHDLPDPFALERIAPALALFGVKIPKKPTPDPALYQQIIDRLHRADGGHIGQRLLLGCLMRAEYSPVNRGHFGLGSSCYCHFTSPIRRYPDLLTHRVLKDWLQGRVDDEYREAAAALAKNAAGISNRTADDSERIEREAVRVKSMEFMKDQEGGVFEGWISGIARSGFFVELVEYPVEGFVPTASLSGDVYAPNASQTRIEGRRGGRSWRLAQRVQVQVIRVHPEVGDMELALIEGGARGTGPKGRSRKKSRKEKGSADQGKMRGKRGRAK